MKLEKEKIGLITILAVSIIAVVGISLQNPIEQDLKYHLFCDERTFLGVPNFWNVISNLPFLVVGLWGGHWVVGATQHNLLRGLKPAYFILFIGISLVSMGSGYYHLLPNNVTLVWDRIPMTIAFMALFSVVIGEFISVRISQILLLPLLIFGIFSVTYWYLTESQGEGDLRLYAIVQFLPMLLIPLILLLFKPVYTLTGGYWLLLGSYLLAKVFEYFDSAIFDILPLLSGHSLKHVTAAFGVFFLIRAYKHREPI